MKKLFFLLLSFTIFNTSLEACVTYDPGTAKYTVDNSGSVEPVTKQKEKINSQKEKEKKVRSSSKKP